MPKSDHCFVCTPDRLRRCRCLAAGFPSSCAACSGKIGRPRDSACRPGRPIGLNGTGATPDFRSRPVIGGAERIFALRYGGAYSFLGIFGSRKAREASCTHLQAQDAFKRVTGRALGGAGARPGSHAQRACGARQLRHVHSSSLCCACLSPGELFGTALGRARLARMQTTTTFPGGLETLLSFRPDFLSRRSVARAS
jgi:hypothetical protein